MNKPEHPGVAVIKRFATMSLGELHALDQREVVAYSPYLKEADVGPVKWVYIKACVMLHAGLVLAGYKK